MQFAMRQCIYCGSNRVVWDDRVPGFKVDCLKCGETWEQKTWEEKTWEEKGEPK